MLFLLQSSNCCTVCCMYKQNSRIPDGDRLVLTLVNKHVWKSCYAVFEISSKVRHHQVVMQIVTPSLENYYIFNIGNAIAIPEI
jgi:hypothetical protein